MPVIFAAGTLSFLELASRPGELSWSVFALGITVSAVTAYLCIYFFIALVERIGMLPFVLYRIALSILLFIVFL